MTGDHAKESSTLGDNLRRDRSRKLVSGTRIEAEIEAATAISPRAESKMMIEATVR
jgi:hypothetical protein